MTTLLSFFHDYPGNKVFLALPDGSALTYEEFFALTARLAGAIRACGVRPGDRVAVQVDKSPEALALYVACIRAGAVYLPLNTAYTASEIAYFVADAEPRLVVCRPSAQAANAALAKQVGGRAETLGTAGDGTLMTLAADQPDRFEDHPAGPDDLAAILYTSGTTGRSKGAMMTHRNLASNALTLVECWRFTADDVLLHALPIYHTHGLFVATNVVLSAHASMLFLPKFDAEDVIRLLPRATVMMGVPTFYTRLLDHPAFSRELVSGMRLFISGSAPLLASTHEDFAARSGHAILERYGMTETGMITSNPLDGVRAAGTVGRPLHGVSVRITAEDGNVCGPGSVGAVEVRGPNVFAGYWQMPDKTREEFTADGWFRTGDVGEWVAEGPAKEYLRLAGRAKDMIISGGLNVYPKEIEEIVDAMPGVAESAVIGVPDPDFGEAVTAVVVAANGQSIDGDAVIAALRREIAAYKVPKRVHIVAELPRNAMGKVQKNVLRERFAGSEQ
jgi:malonyl-CoA/methylmalonyl-CoA synthetase